jgi:ferrous iron transport protein B
MRTSEAALTAGETSQSSLQRTLENPGIVALVGTPNSGKTTLFNWLTGSRFKTVNYPGATVEYSVGMTHERYGAGLKVMDTPGTYSLDPKSPDEQVTHNAIFKHESFGAAELVINVADATHLGRHLFLTRQLLSAGFDVVLAVTMADLLSERGEELDTDALSRELGIPVVLIDGRLGGGVTALVETVRLKLREIAARESSHPKPAPRARWSPEEVEEAFREAGALSSRVISLSRKREEQKQKRTAKERTQALDRFFLHPVWGLLNFITVMGGFFSAIFWLAAPLMDLVDGGFSQLGDWVLSFGPENLALQFLSHGVIASAAAVLVFVPQVFILFLGITLLEDSGYLARAATLIDRPLSLLGLGGRSFVPLLSGYACAVPAMMAARTISSKRERWLTLFILPLMSCSARLPVYALLLSFLFRGGPSWKPGLTLTGLYVGSLVVGAIAALVAGRILKLSRREQTTDRSIFMLELPVYRRPKLTHVLHQVLTRTKGYVKRAGPMIFTFALIMWLATTFPHAEIQDPSERLNASYAAQAGQWIEPIFEPMGGDWRTGVGLMSAFAAREVFVSSLAVVFHVAGDADETMQETLLEKMQAAHAPNGYPLFTVASVLGLIVFFMIALQCLSTFTVAIREAGSTKFALMQLVVFNVVAYGLAVAIVQGLRAFGIA